MQQTYIYIVVGAALTVCFVSGYMLALLLAWGKALEKQVGELKDRLAELSQPDYRQPKRHTQATDAGLLDALAISLDILQEQEAVQAYTDARMRQLQDVIKRVKSGPNGYDPERPAGERPKRRHER